MRTLLIRLAAAMQSYGIESKFDIRHTGREPTKSTVIGILSAALGIRRDDDAVLEKLSALKFGVRVDKEGEQLVDLHMAHGEKTSYLTRRYYLADAVFLVGISGADDLLEQLDAALKHPVFPLFLGRRSCPPTLPVTLGIREAELLQALTDEPWIAPEWYQKKCMQSGQPELRLITDAMPGEYSAARQKDAPVSYNPIWRKYQYRAVVDRGFVMPISMIEMTETQHDAMEEVMKCT